MYDIGFTA